MERDRELQFALFGREILGPLTHVKITSSKEPTLDFPEIYIYRKLTPEKFSLHYLC